MCYASNRNIPSFTGWGEWRLTSGDHKHWLIQPSFFFFWGGGGVTWRRDPSQVPQNWKLRGFRPLFLGRSQNLLSKKWRNVRFATGKGGPQNQQKYDRGLYFWCRRKMCVCLCISVGIESIMLMIDSHRFTSYDRFTGVELESKTDINIAFEEYWTRVWPFTSMVKKTNFVWYSRTTDNDNDYRTHLHCF